MEYKLQQKCKKCRRSPMTYKYEIRISQQPQVRSYSNLKLKLMGSNQSVQRYEMKMSYGRQPPREDDLII
jgi:hypothetical protein